MNYLFILRLLFDIVRLVCFLLELGRRGWSELVRRLREMLGGCEELILEVLFEENKNRRFGNGVCRVWYGKLGERI